MHSFIGCFRPRPAVVGPSPRPSVEFPACGVGVPFDRASQASGVLGSLPDAEGLRDADAGFFAASAVRALRTLLKKMPLRDAAPGRGSRRPKASQVLVRHALTEPWSRPSAEGPMPPPDEDEMHQIFLKVLYRSGRTYFSKQAGKPLVIHRMRDPRNPGRMLYFREDDALKVQVGLLDWEYGQNRRPRPGPRV